MADFNDIRDTLAGTFSVVAGKTKELACLAHEKAKLVGKIAKLNLELNSEKDTIQKAYVEIGKLYYDTRKNDPDGFFVQLCDEITLAKENIAGLQQQIDLLKAEMGAKCSAADDIDVEFENVEPEAEANPEGEAKPEAEAKPESEAEAVADSEPEKTAE